MNFVAILNITKCLRLEFSLRERPTISFFFLQRAKKLGLLGLLEKSLLAEIVMHKRVVMSSKSIIIVAMHGALSAKMLQNSAATAESE